MEGNRGQPDLRYYWQRSCAREVSLSVNYPAREVKVGQVTENPVFRGLSAPVSDALTLNDLTR
jgi:hypothetical protein